MKLDIATAPNRDSKMWKQGTIEWTELLRWAQTPASKKEAGNYLLGKLANGIRSNTTVITRSALTLDVDYPRAGFMDDFELLADFRYLAHTTFSSSPDAPRYRIIIPLSRPVLPDEYEVASKAFMARYGEDAGFDVASSRPAQYMFRPAAKEPKWYWWKAEDGPLLDPDELLTEFVDDLSSLKAKTSRSKRDPFEIDGVVGAFNRAYSDFQLLIDTYDLPYEPDGTRWHLVGARSVAGMGLVTEGIVFSHHSHDPAFGVACTAFDLVRLHRFGELDEGSNPQTPVNRRKSYSAMLDVAGIDPRVTAELVGVDFSATLDDLADEDRDPNAWKLGLRMNPRTGEFDDDIRNWDLVLANDPVFKALYFNDMTLSVEISEDLPWRSLGNGGETWTKMDDSALMFYIEREYGYRPSAALVEALVTTHAQKSWVTPVKDYLLSLEGTWDGKPRVETSLPGVRPTRFTRLVARKALVAAVARMLDPGCKWDHTVVLYGGEGLGKTFWVDKISRGYMATLGRLTDKDTLVILHRSWFMLADEGYSLKKADVDVQKEFLTRTEDVFRMPYDRGAVLHRRRNVFWSTTNDEIFLRRQEGNRRFLIVHCEEEVDYDALTDDYIDQLWAEALHLYRNGERLFLEDTEKELAASERERFTEEDNLSGLIEEYLDRLVPENWDAMSPESRRMWMMEFGDGVASGSVRQDVTCSTQIWVELLGNPLGKRDRAGLLEITNTLKRMPEWTLLPGRHRVPNYGSQAIFVRTDTLEEGLI